MSEDLVVEVDLDSIPARDRPIRLILVSCWHHMGAVDLTPAQDLHRMIERTLVSHSGDLLVRADNPGQMTLVRRESAAETVGWPVRVELVRPGDC
jgi:hypothetical protein